MSNNKITIVINTFKSEDKIHNCLKSIDNNFKVIVVENSKNMNFKNELENKYSNVECVLAVSYTHLRAHETLMNLVCRLLLEKSRHRLS